MKENKKKITIYDVAREADVSPGTVSRYINGVGESREEAKERIEKAIETLGYVPNRSARALKSKKNNMLCLTYPESDNPFFFSLVDTIETEARKHGYSLMIYHTHGKPEEEIKIMSLTKEGLIDGLILVNFNYTEKHFKMFKQINCPLVISSLCVSPYGGNATDSYDYVGIDVYKGLYMSTTHMIEQGHKKIAYIGGSNKLCVFKERYDGYCDALSKAGIKINEKYTFVSGYNQKAGYDAGIAIAEMEDRPTALCAASDVIAMGAMKAFKEKNIRIPEDIAIVGVDNIDFDEALTPQLSSVKMMQQELGKRAFEFILERIKGSTREPQKIIYQPELVVRESSEMIK